MTERGFLTLQIVMLIILLIFVPCCLDKQSRAEACNKEQGQKIEELENYIKKVEHKLVVQEQLFDAIIRGKEEW